MRSSKDRTLELLQTYRTALWRKTIAKGFLPQEEAACDAYMRSINAAMETLKKAGGKKMQGMYWSVYYTYMSDTSPRDATQILDWIVDSLNRKLHRSSYYRLLNLGIEELTRILEELKESQSPAICFDQAA